MAFIEIQNIGKIEVPDNLSESQQDQIVQKVVKDYQEASSAVSPSGVGEYAARQAGLTARAAMTPTTLGALTGAGIGSMVGGVGAAPGAVAGATAGFLTDIGSRVYSSLTGQGKPLNELLEEIGGLASELIPLGFIYGTTNLFANGSYLFFTKLEALGSPQLDEGVEAIERYSVKEFESLLLAGEIQETHTISAFCQARLRGLL